MLVRYFHQKKEKPACNTTPILLFSGEVKLFPETKPRWPSKSCEVLNPRSAESSQCVWDLEKKKQKAAVGRESERNS